MKITLKSYLASMAYIAMVITALLLSMKSISVGVIVITTSTIMYHIYLLKSGRSVWYAYLQSISMLFAYVIVTSEVWFPILKRLFTG